MPNVANLTGLARPAPRTTNEVCGEDIRDHGRSLGIVRMTDTRGASAGAAWVASVSSTAFSSAVGPAIPASAVGYAVGTITSVGTATYTANDPRNLTGVSAAVTATGVTGDNSAEWNRR
jgi:hypothetical protein